MRFELRTAVNRLTVPCVILFSAALLLSACGGSDMPTDPSPPDGFNPDSSLHFAFGIPSDDDPSNDYIIWRRQYFVSYNDFLRCPNYVCWHLSSDWYGDVPRYGGNFITDTSLPDGFYRVKHSDYTNSGYDRGHMVRSEERTRTDEDNKSTFLLTNIIPQRPDLNRGVWLDLEYWCESMCKDSLKELYVIAGGIFHEPHDRLNSVVAVPDSCFKIVVVLEKGQGLAAVNASTRVVAVIMPNIDGIRSDPWEQYHRSVDAVELATGYDFLNLIPDDIEESIER
jgi:endonuclease G